MCFCCSCTWTSPRFPKALLCTMKIIFCKTHEDYNKSKSKFLLATVKYTKTLLMFNKNLKKEWSWTYNLKLIIAINIDTTALLTMYNENLNISHLINKCKGKLCLHSTTKIRVK